MAVQYDPKIIVTFAERLYAEAASIIRTYTLLGVLMGVVAGTVLLMAGSAGPAAVVGLMGVPSSSVDSVIW